MIVYVCNKCGKQIPIVKKRLFPGGPEIDVLDCGHIKCEQINLGDYRNPDVHYCKSCAREISLEIDNHMLKFKMDILSGKI